MSTDTRPPEPIELAVLQQQGYEAFRDSLSPSRQLGTTRARYYGAGYADGYQHAQEEAQEHLNAVVKNAVDLLVGRCTAPGRHEEQTSTFDGFMAAGGNACPICLTEEVATLQREMAEARRAIYADVLTRLTMFASRPFPAGVSQDEMRDIRYRRKGIRDALAYLREELDVA